MTLSSEQLLQPEPFRAPLTPPHSVDSPSDSERDETGPSPRRLRVRCTVMRAGTSKGLFFRQEDLPEDRLLWDPILLAAMGSPDPNGRQLNGMGGGQSTQSKVAIVSVSEHPDADVDYLFAQIPIDGDKVDYSGNCGNMASGVGPFAVEENLFPVMKAHRHLVSVRIRNVNTDRIIRSTFEVNGYLPVENGGMKLDGVGGSGAPVRLDFLDPAGSMTGRLLPTGQAIDLVTLPPSTPLGRPRTFRVSCVDAANPFVFVHRDELGLTGGESLDQLASVTSTLMEIRAYAAVKMGLAPSPEAAALVMGTPKIAIVGAPCRYTALSGKTVEPEEHDLWLRAYSMGRPHPAIQMTGAVCVGSSTSIPGTLAYEAFSQSRLAGGKTLEGPVIIGHGSGTMAVEGLSHVGVQGEVVVECGTVYRTARRLMEGMVLCYV